MKRYVIQDKAATVITPTGEVLAAEQWKSRYPVAEPESITVVWVASEVNGDFFGTLGQRVQTYKGMGAGFSACETAEEKLAVIEAFEDAMSNFDEEPTHEERMAAAMVKMASEMGSSKQSMRKSPEKRTN